ncbi:hypothetical protein LVY72_10630 [Arthrobacter sp. I2-34]|uniref:Ketohydroxyglutarate aldolase n=1 Tax=Arthrobacter hankyongi TaxID=2904801 RepID=A0ABS9L6V3_9MICC|nr:hypothetical protein [Arthrobacter hankyongi]MCG2622370.1 hypothetical protein [Arthrobacter hankyongi]
MVNISVTVEQDHLSMIGDVAEALRARGMQVTQVLQSGFITGSVSEDCRQALAAVSGVQTVDEQLQFQLPPPQEEVQ